MHDHFPDRLPGPGWPDVGLGRGTADLAPAAPDSDRVARPVAPGPAHATRRDRARQLAGHQRLPRRIAPMTSREFPGQSGAVWIMAAVAEIAPGRGSLQARTNGGTRPGCHVRMPLPG